jgi:hypothetical protein
MSIYLDQKYLLLISNRLPLFKKKNDTTYNCRCVICGDSQKNRRKARGYFFSYKTDIRYKCYNCDLSLNFSNFLKLQDANLYSQYALEKYSEGHSKSANAVPEFKFEEPVFKTSEEKLIDKLLDRLDTLPDDNEAVIFCTGRKIPKNRFKQLYYIDNIKNIVQLNEKYKESIQGKEPRLVLPFYDNNGQLSGVTCRALRGEALRYITVKVKEDVPLIFGIDSIDKLNPVYVVEGPIDSLFLPNSIAIGGTSFGKIHELDIEKERIIIVFDNQPRNKEVCKLIEKNIDKGYQVVIWPQNLLEKDINEMVLAGRSVAKILKENTFKGLTAMTKYIAWKRC